MRTKILLLLTLAALIFASCSKDDETDAVWEENNKAAFLKTAASSGYETIESASKNGTIAYKVLKSGSEDAPTPLFTDAVRVLYTGWYKQFDWNKPDTYVNDDGVKLNNKYIFDLTSGNARRFEVKGLVDGFTTALQHMKVGDKWEVWIPARLGYGMTPKQNIPVNTTLVFEIELLEILK